MRPYHRIVVALILALAFSPTFAAGTATSSMNVTATVDPTCTISAGTLGFGLYDPVTAHTASDLISQSDISVKCTLGSTGTVTLSEGLAPGSGSSPALPLRRMAGSSGSHLSYLLFSDATRLTAFGNTALTGKSHVGTGTPGVVTVYGLIPAGQNVPAGGYADTVIATITF